jgi:hypothetical protein
MIGDEVVSGAAYEEAYVAAVVSRVKRIVAVTSVEGQRVVLRPGGQFRIENVTVRTPLSGCGIVGVDDGRTLDIGAHEVDCQRVSALSTGRDQAVASNA